MGPVNRSTIRTRLQPKGAEGHSEFGADFGGRVWVQRQITLELAIHGVEDGVPLSHQPAPAMRRATPLTELCDCWEIPQIQRFL